MRNPFDPGYYCSEELRGFGFKAVGENVRISRACNIVGLENIEIGNNVRIDAYCSLIAAAGYIRLGDYIHIGGYGHLAGRGGIEIGDFTGISQGVSVYSVSDDFTGYHMTNPTVPAELTGVKMAPVIIGRHCIIGGKSTLLPGARLGEGVAIGAMSLVTKPVPDWEIHCGRPAKKGSARLRRALVLEQRLHQFAATG